MIGPPKDTPDYAYPAWAAALRVASQDPVAVAAFTRETGFVYLSPQSAMDVMIDQATGRDQAYVRAFVAWFNEKVWGPWKEPESSIWGG